MRELVIGAKIRPLLQVLETRRLYFALSRTPHGVIDLATPCLAALAVNGGFPPWWIVILGLITAFSGYTAVYAINDIADYRSDRQRRLMMNAGSLSAPHYDLDAVLMRHPLAEGALNLKQALLWAGLWSGVAVFGAAILNPVCLMLFVAGCVLEIVYCHLLKISAYRSLVSGVVKTIGAMAAVFAVDPDPPPLFLVNLFLFLFFWEIGGQNIPNDWSDIDEDRAIGARTFPVQLGRHKSAIVVFCSVCLALIFQTMTFLSSRAPFPALSCLLALAAGVWLVLLPAIRLLISRDARDAMDLFNHGSYFPLSLLLIVVGTILLR